MRPLYNHLSGRWLKQKMHQEGGQRVTLSFYRYHPIKNPAFFRDHLYISLGELGVLGRIYVASEGINAQLSVPGEKLDDFKNRISEIRFLSGIRLNQGIEDNGKSFFKLKVKVRNKIVADGLTDRSFEASDSGIRLNASQFNRMIESSQPIVVDMRNHYESAIGHFRNAVLTDADTFREALVKAEHMLRAQKDREVIMYCTGGIRCEKASAYFKHRGFKKVYQLDGGIIHYAREVKALGLPNYFTGKNFVFDGRLGERISPEVIAECHLCGRPCDDYSNCRNPACNLLFIACEECMAEMEGCCSEHCREITHLPESDQKKQRRGADAGIRIFSKARSSGKGDGKMIKKAIGR